MSADLRFTKCTDSSVFLLFWSATPRVRWMELRLLSQNRPHARKWVWFENARSKSGVSRSPTNREPKNHHFSTTSQLNGNFNGLYLRSETWYRQSGKCVDMGSFYIVSKCHDTNRRLIKIRPAFLPTLRKFCILIQCLALQMQIS